MWHGLRQRKLNFHLDREDAITSTIGSRLAYLPEDVWLSLLQAFFGENLAAGPLESVSFWPQWRLPDSRRVEPDIVYEFHGLRLIVEAKRDDAWQTTDQWHREKRAAEHSLPDGKLIRLLALGGESDSSPESLGVCAITWREFAAILRKEFEASDSCPAALAHDLDEALAYFGFCGWRWFGDGEILKCRLDRGLDSISVFALDGLDPAAWWEGHTFLRGNGNLEVFEHMTVEPERVRKALVDVRQAYRLIYLYQSRLLTVAKAMAEYFDYGFFRFLPAGWDKGVQPGSDPADMNDWLFLPLLDASILYLPSGADQNLQSPNQWMLEVRLRSDSMRPLTPKKMTKLSWAQGDEAETSVLTYAFQPGQEKQTWWMDLWNNSQWPEQDDLPWVDGDGRKVARLTHRVEDLLDATGISEAMTRFEICLDRHGFPKAERGLQLM